MTNSGKITKFCKNKGYESLPREMLQDEHLSLEAIGLLSNLQSYSDNWKLYKTELYTRFSKNKRTSIDRIWEELVNAGYILQFRKRVGKKYMYQYIISTEKYSRADAINLIKNAKENGYLFYHKEMLKSTDMKNVDPIDYIKIENKDFSSVEKQQSKKERKINVSSSVDFEQSNLNCSKRTASRFTIKRFTKKRKNEEEDIDKKKDSSSRLKKMKQSINQANDRQSENTQLISQLITKDDNLKSLTKTLIKSDVSLQDIATILTKFDQLKLDIVPDIITQQMSWMIQKAKMDGIGDYGVYFIEGYIKRLEASRIQVCDTLTEELSELLGLDDIELPKIPMFDWLNNDDVQYISV